MIETVAGAITGAAATHGMQKVSEQISGTTADHIKHHFGGPIARIEDALCAIAENTSHEREEPYEDRMTLQPGIYMPLSKRGRLYNMMFVSSPTAMQFQVIGLPVTALTLTSGWNILNLPDESQVSLPSTASGNVSVLYRAANVMYGSAI